MSTDGPPSIGRLMITFMAWWRHQMETFSVLLAICAGNSPVPDEFPAQGPVARSFDVFFHLLLNIRLSKQSLCWWFETLSRPLWRHRNGQSTYVANVMIGGTTLISLRVNSLRPNDAYMRHQPRPSLVQIMASRLFGSKLLSESMLHYCQLDP